MLDLKTADITQSRFYQEVTALGRQEAAAALVLRLLNRKCGTLTPAQVSQVQGLTLEALEQLGEDLLDFASVADLEAWLG
jgi:predicted transposase YdaD